MVAKNELYSYGYIYRWILARLDQWLNFGWIWLNFWRIFSAFFVRKLVFQQFLSTRFSLWLRFWIGCWITCWIVCWKLLNPAENCWILLKTAEFFVPKIALEWDENRALRSILWLKFHQFLWCRIRRDRLNEQIRMVFEEIVHGYVRLNWRI